MQAPSQEIADGWAVGLSKLERRIRHPISLVFAQALVVAVGQQAARKHLARFIEQFKLADVQHLPFRGMDADGQALPLGRAIGQGVRPFVFKTDGLDDRIWRRKHHRLRGHVDGFARRAQDHHWLFVNDAKAGLVPLKTQNARAVVDRSDHLVNEFSAALARTRGGNLSDAGCVALLGHPVFQGFARKKGVGGHLKMAARRAIDIKIFRLFVVRQDDGAVQTVAHGGRGEGGIFDQHRQAHRFSVGIELCQGTVGLDVGQVLGRFHALRRCLKLGRAGRRRGGRCLRRHLGQGAHTHQE